MDEAPINVFRPNELVALAEMMEAAEGRLIRAIGSGTGRMMDDLQLLVAGAAALRVVAKGKRVVPSGEQIKAHRKKVGMNQVQAIESIEAACGKNIGRVMFITWENGTCEAPYWFDLDLLDWKHIIDRSKAHQQEVGDAQA